MNDEYRRSTPDDGSAPPDRRSRSGDVIAPDGHIPAEALSEYLDDPSTFTVQERQIVEAHLESCAECRETFGELRALVAALQELPEIEPPRSFALTPAMVGASRGARDVREPVVLSERRSWYERALPAARWMTAVAAILFVFVVTADFFNEPGAGGDESEEAAAVVEMQAERNESAEDPSIAQEAADTRTEAAAPEAADEAVEEEAAALQASEPGTPEVGPASEAPVETPETDAPVTGGAAGAAMDEAPTLETFAEEARVDDGDVAADEPLSEPEDDDTADTERWFRIVEITLALLVILGLTALIALPRMGSTR